VRTLGEKKASLETEIETLRQSEQDLLKRIVEVEALLVEQRKTHQLTLAQAKLQQEKEDKLKEEFDALSRAEAEALARMAAVRERIPQLEEARDRAEEEAQLRSEQEKQLRQTIGILREQEDDQVKRIEEIQEHLAAQVKACYVAETEAQDHAEKAELINLEFESVLRNKEDQVKQVEDAETRIRALEATRHGSQVSTQRRTEKEQQLNAELEALRRAEEEQIKRIATAEARLRQHDEARQSARARVKELAAEELRVADEIEQLLRAEAEYLNRIKESETVLPALEEQLRQAEAQARRKADEEQQWLSQIEAAHARAEAESRQRADRERELNAKLGPPASREIEQCRSEVVAEPETEKPKETIAIAEKNTSIAPYEQVKDPLAIEVEAPKATPDNRSGDASGKRTAAQPATSTTVPAREEPAPSQAAGDAQIPADIIRRLQSGDSSQRAAALVDLAETGGDESFALITKSFDDPSVEVRNAAARALYSLQPDQAASFTHALREAPAERRRKIGTAIAASGLAANAINSLTGEGRDKTYSAFSILFLMAKAGEVQPLMQAIANHPNIEVRLTSVKLLALSNQQHVLPGLRSLAGKRSLPVEIQTAVMEAIYQLSNQSPDVG
ncbi:MAG TPA: hypothetical protein VKD91_04415, partial [Pyrinomonadaceae bacterium]|nr:hypothetical protein [Pyrinomonadaceae bacterium]